MRILLIGNFAPPYEEESLHNLSLLNRLKDEGNDCCVINISENPSKEDEFIDGKNFLNFVFKLIRYAWKKDVIHCSTKGYMRPGLIKIIVSVIIGRCFRAKAIITLHSELFTILGKMRSKLLGKPVLRLLFFLANRVICTDKDTYETAAAYKTKNNFELIPLFIHIPKNIKENELSVFKKLENKKRIIVFSNTIYPSFIFEILNNLLSKYASISDIGIVISFSEKLSIKLQHAIEEIGNRFSDNLVFIEPSEMRLLSMAYAKANLILRPLSCDGKTFFPNFTISLKKPVCSANYLYFPISLLFVKEGETADLCANIINNLLKENSEKLSYPKGEDDFYDKIKNIYLEK